MGDSELLRRTQRIDLKFAEPGLVAGEQKETRSSGKRWGEHACVTKICANPRHSGQRLNRSGVSEKRPRRGTSSRQETHQLLSNRTCASSDRYYQLGRSHIELHPRHNWAAATVLIQSNSMDCRTACTKGRV